MKRHIFNSVKKIRGMDAFSMPGHKSKDVFDFDFEDDITEVMGTDNLLNPSECILESEKEMAEIFNVRESFYMVNGSTGAIHVAISCCTKPSDRILIMRNCHKSVYNALVLNNLNVDYIYPVYNKKYNLFTGINLDDLDRLMMENSYKAVVVTSPTYFGMILDIKKISEIVHSHGAYLIVDEAHGTHLSFTDLNKYSAVNYADFTVHSTHKTTPSLTQSAILHCNSSDFTREFILKRINLFLSTSPSYLLTQSSEFAVYYMEKYGNNLYERNLKLIRQMKSRLSSKIKFFNGDEYDKSFIALDESKILFGIEGMTGQDIVKYLFLRYNIRLEMGDLDYALALSSVCDEEADFKNLEKALEELSKDAVISDTGYAYIDFIRPECVLKPAEAFYMDSFYCNLDNAAGKISAGIVAAYPPGIPILSYGERITKVIIDNIKKYTDAGIEVIGIENGRIEVLV